MVVLILEEPHSLELKAKPGGKERIESKRTPGYRIERDEPRKVPKDGREN